MGGSFAAEDRAPSRRWIRKPKPRVLAAAAKAGLTPELLACDAVTGALVTRYLAKANSLDRRTSP